MRKLFFLILTFLSFNFLNAQALEDFYFSEAQPGSSDDLTVFPEEFLGVYQSVADTFKLLEITEDSIFVRLGTPIVLTLDQIEKDSLMVIEEGKLKGLDLTMDLPFVQINDTIVTLLYQRYPFFRMGKDCVLRKAGENLVLSFMQDEKTWTTMLLSLNVDGITFSHLEFDAEEKNLRSTGKLKIKKSGDLQTGRVTLTEKEFLDYLDKGGYTRQEKYLEVR